MEDGCSPLSVVVRVSMDVVGGVPTSVVHTQAACFVAMNKQRTYQRSIGVKLLKLEFLLMLELLNLQLLLLKLFLLGILLLDQY